MAAMTPEPRADPAADHHGADPSPAGSAPWLVVSRRADDAGDPVPRTARLLLTVAAATVVVLVVVAVVGVLAARKLAEREAVNDAANRADLLADAVVQPALRDTLPGGDRTAAGVLGDVLREYLASSSLVRVKVWTRDGRVVYSDEPRLVGRTFPLDEEEQAVFAAPRTVAEVSDLGQPENVYERGQGRLLEVYRPIWTPDGTPLLFETYAPYDEVDTRAAQLWRGFAGVTVSSLLLFAGLLTPVVWRLLGRLRRAQRQREALLQRAVEASADERRRIAGTLHDGVVQELAATSFAVSGAAARADQAGVPALAEELRSSAATLRGSIGGLRSLLVDIYPPSLESAGLADALEDLAGGLRSRGVTVVVEAQPGMALTSAQERLVFRVTRECLQNVRRHAAARHVRVALAPESGGAVLTIDDDGAGFDPARVLAAPEDGHFGLRVLSDVATEAGAELAVSSRPGAGCRWRLRVPAAGRGDEEVS
jgi:signal transduction histidine kinase